jgi:hypothetical protein
VVSAASAASSIYGSRLPKTANRASGGSRARTPASARRSVRLISPPARIATATETSTRAVSIATLTSSWRSQSDASRSPDRLAVSTEPWSERIPTPTPFESQAPAPSLDGEFDFER